MIYKLSICITFLFLLASCTSEENEKIVDENLITTGSLIYIDLTEDELSDQLKKDKINILEEENKIKKELEIRANKENAALKKA
jgi:hypothetical protein